MTITYQSDAFDTLGYGIIYHRPHEKACAQFVAREIQRIFGLPQTIDEDEDAVYIEIDDRRLFYGDEDSPLKDIFTAMPARNNNRPKCYCFSMINML